MRTVHSGRGLFDGLARRIESGDSGPPSSMSLASARITDGGFRRSIGATKPSAFILDMDSLIKPRRM